MTVCPSAAMYSFGAYVASEATVSVPFDLIAAGTKAATLAVAAGVALVLATLDELLLLLLLLPQPATSAADTQSRTGKAASRRLRRRMVDLL
jgi:hypothetical protein